ncbi:MAG: glycosyltransferase, partial [Elusimicrobia bacterium]|nr:glycosyltransferase [Elusimicrobiota bacterium]
MSQSPVPRLSIVIPAFNEERRLPRTLDALFTFLDKNPPGEFEVVVVDDGSRDRTSAVVEEFARGRPRLRLLRLERNSGRGRAVREGVRAARGEIIL